ncbi:MAG: hypothetical protein FWD30_01965 [Dehalococcoidia bacterium]|nr:hypothetical protein [Dehalococcoidia bacterium]
MSTVKAYFDGVAFVPMGTVDMAKGKIVELAIVRDEVEKTADTKRLEAFRKLTNEFHELNMSEPIPQEFDEIIQSRIDFSREPAL